MNNYNKAKAAYLQARDGINIKENEQIVLKCKNGWSYAFVISIKGADIKAHENVILELKDPEYSCYFAKYILGANIEEHFKVVFNSRKKDWLDFFIEKINYKGTKVEEWLMYI